MAGSVNKCLIIGNLGKDPEIRPTANGKVCNLTVATSETWNDKASGERKEKTEWHRIVVWNERIIDVAEKYLKKGRKVYIEGSLETRKWTDQNGQDRFWTEIVLRPFNGVLTILDKNTEGGEGAAAPAARSRPAYTPKPGDTRPGMGGGSAMPDLDDSIPFSPCWQ